MGTSLSLLDDVRTTILLVGSHGSLNPLHFVLINIGWVHAHNSLRQEMRSLIEALESAKARGSLKEWEVKCIQSAWGAHEAHIHSHHENEDVHLVPFMMTRFHYPDKVSPF
jgi:hypothetical protein